MAMTSNTVWLDHSRRVTNNIRGVVCGLASECGSASENKTNLHVMSFRVWNMYTWRYDAWEMWSEWYQDPKLDFHRGAFWWFYRVDDKGVRHRFESPPEDTPGFVTKVLARVNPNAAVCTAATAKRKGHPEDAAAAAKRQRTDNATAKRKERPEDAKRQRRAAVPAAVPEPAAEPTLTDEDIEELAEVIGEYQETFIVTGDVVVGGDTELLREMEKLLRGVVAADTLSDLITIDDVGGALADYLQGVVFYDKAALLRHAASIVKDEIKKADDDGALPAALPAAVPAPEPLAGARSAKHARSDFTAKRKQRPVEAGGATAKRARECFHA